VTFIIIGIISILTPFTPVGFMFFVGLELLGVREVFGDKIKKWAKRFKKENKL
jgi:hypothetical protein